MKIRELKSAIANADESLDVVILWEGETVPVKKVEIVYSHEYPKGDPYICNWEKEAPCPEYVCCHCDDERTGDSDSRRIKVLLID